MVPGSIPGARTFAVQWRAFDLPVSCASPQARPSVGSVWLRVAMPPPRPTAGREAAPAVVDAVLVVLVGFVVLAVLVVILVLVATVVAAAVVFVDGRCSCCCCVCRCA